jgi:Ni/Fe-hydrogenase 1 B-type cytochrome subunit
VVIDSNINNYKAWDVPTRVFHWLNVLCVILLSILGLIMLNKAAIGISGREAGIGLKTIHVLVGYVFAINLIVRTVWGFFGERYSRWSSLLPGKNFRQEISAYKDSVKAGQPQVFIGHNPKGRISVLVLMLFLAGMMVTGMIRAGTDIYYPPFGNIAANYVAEDGVSPSEIKPYDKAGTNADKMAELQAFKKPFGMIHVYGAYVLWLLILIHVIAVIRAETSGEGTLISAMFSGKKHLSRKPEDL